MTLYDLTKFTNIVQIIENKTLSKIETNTLYFTNFQENSLLNVNKYLSKVETKLCDDIHRKP